MGQSRTTKLLGPLKKWVLMPDLKMETYMEKIDLIDAAKLTAPNPVSLVCSMRPDGQTNLATVSWWTLLSLEPARIGFAMMKPSCTGEMVRENKKVILSVPGIPLARAVMECGSTTGRTTNKVDKFGIELKAVPGSDIQIPAHSVVAIQCGLHEFVDVGDHYFYICNVENVYADNTEQAVFAWKGYLKIAPVPGANHSS